MFLYVNADLTGKARIRQAAMHLIARRGASRTSLRLVANRARVSIALIGHHYGCKQALSDSLDAFVLRCLSDATTAVVAQIPPNTPLAETCALLVRALLRAMLTEPDMRNYIRRHILDTTGKPEGSQVLNQLGAHIERLLTPLLDEPAGADHDIGEWWTQQILTLAIGPALMRPLPLDGIASSRDALKFEKELEKAPFGILFSVLPAREMSAAHAA